ncbi:hypothetical protein AB685_19490 [Bacillus sp. LL01]|uniref:TlpA family protein disulfide reductase n=1 Tax=Bacillus sp. LL01 TaxID=1665556 RepID=UPI00064D68E8|nr:hypothetical protein [Bacillus sp. LL01]KMJ56905.1 hypothetical protein AB685_19490 [Bacillus sp. LL01]
MEFINLTYHIILWVIIIVHSLMFIKLYKIIEKSTKKPVALPGDELGLPIGTKFPIRRVMTINNKEFSLQSSSKQGTIVLLTSPNCDICNNIYPYLNNLQNQTTDFNSIMFSLSNKDLVTKLVLNYGIEMSVSSLEEDELSKLGKIGLPFAYFISGEGVIRGKGIINRIEDLNMILPTKAA